MWPRVVQTNDAAILKAKAMAKTHSSFGKDLSEVSSLWKNRAVKIMSSVDNDIGMVFAGGEQNLNNKLPITPLRHKGAVSKSLSKMSRR